MNSINEKNLKYINILNRIHKKLSKMEAVLIMKKQYFTDNKFYYLLCLALRFIYLLSFLGDYRIFFGKKNSNKIFQQYIHKLTSYNIAKELELSFKTYSCSIIIILIISLIRLLINFYIFKKINDYKDTNIWPLPNKYLIIVDHIRFAIFSYLIEYLSFPYYIILLSEKFIPSLNTSNKINLIILIIINTFLILLYNFELFWDMICINKIYTISKYEIRQKRDEDILNYNRNNHFSFKCSEYFICILIIFQNIPIFLNIELYTKAEKILKIVITIFVLIIILIIISKLLTKFDYPNFILKIMNILFLFCFYTIIMDLLLAKFLIKRSNLYNNLIYIIIKIIISYLSLSIIILKSNNLFQEKIIKLLFYENNDKTKENSINSLYYLHEIMLKIKTQQNIENAVVAIKFINNKHIKNCNKAICNCKLLNIFINEQIINNDELIKYNEKLIIILNYLFESVFIDYDYYNNYDASVLLAEHYCHIKDNPIMAFSLVKTFFMKQKNKNLTREIKVLLYELSQKYIYYITSKFQNIQESIQDEEECLLNDKIEKEFNLFFTTLKTLIKIKSDMLNYINNYINILKYKNIFDDSLSLIYDENNENIISVKNNFFTQINKIDDEGNKNKIKKSENKNNLYNVINLLTKEKYFYQKIEKSINNLDKMQNIPIEMIFKFILFINIFAIEKIKRKTKEKLYKFLDDNKTSQNTYTNKDEYEILKSHYKRKNNENDSKIYSIFELKREIITKYFSEYGALKLGFEQKEIINEKIDILMPEKFRNSHLNMVKYFIINKQSKLNLNKQIYFYDKTTTILYPVNIKISFIYNINKYLSFLAEIIFIFENKYRFMLDNNLELIANSINFENEYYLNQKIFQIYNINLIDLLSIHPDKLKNAFKNTIQNIHHQKKIRQAKAEEYFLPQLYVAPGEKPISIMNNNYFKKSKNQIISKLLNLNNKENDKEETEEDKKSLINNKSNNLFSEIFTNSQSVSFSKTYNKILNKKYFIEKIVKELLKIPENDLILEKDKIIHNLVNNSKKLSMKLLTKNELSNQFIQISTEFKFCYDKVFYFITINDENKSFFNINKKTLFEERKYKKSQLTSSNIIKKDLLKKLGTNKLNEDKIEQKIIEKEENQDYNKLDEIREKINKNKFILIIKIILSSIIVSIIIINIILMHLINYMNNVIDITVCSFFYNLHAKNIIIYINSILLQVFYDYSHLTLNNLNEENDFQNLIYIYTSDLQQNFHNFTTFYILEKNFLNSDVTLLYKKDTFYKIRLFWKETKFISDYTIDGDFLNYYLYAVNITNAKGREPEFIQDLNNYFFYKETKDTQEKTNTIFIRLLYYISNNYQFVYRRFYLLFEEDTYNDYKIYARKAMIIYKILDILVIFLYFICYIVVISFLFYSNQIIIKNVIFLFLDFNEDSSLNKEKDSRLNIKLINEIKKLIEDFNLFRFQNYIENTNKININRYTENKEDIKIIDKKESEKISIDKMINHNSKGRNKLVERKIKGIYNSSSNYLSASNSQLFKDNLNNNSVKINKNLSFNTLQNNKKKDEDNDENIHQLILNKSSRTVLLFILIYYIILTILLIALIGFYFYKINLNIKLNEEADEIYIDSIGVTDRYNILFYYFNIFRTLIIFPEGEKKRQFEEIMENLEKYYEKENARFLEIMSRKGMTNNFFRCTNLINIYSHSKSNSTEKLKKMVCEDNISCQKYLDSNYNFFDSGLDFGFKSGLTYISNMYLDYKNLENKTNKDLINSTIINGANSHFKDIGLALNNMFIFALEKLFSLFKDDINGFILYKIRINSLFNIISLVLAITIFIFIIGFIFISLSKYSEPIKESTYRISCSLYCMKINN